MIVLDSHALLWSIAAPAQLSARAQAQLALIEANGHAWASSISLWELGRKAQKGQLDLKIEDLVQRIGETAIELVPVDTAIWLAALALPWKHQDPADRVIVATALARSVPVLTKDRTIRRWSGVECVW